MIDQKVLQKNEKVEQTKGVWKCWHQRPGCGIKMSRGDSMKRETKQWHKGSEEVRLVDRAVNNILGWGGK